MLAAGQHRPVTSLSKFGSPYRVKTQYSIPPYPPPHAHICILLSIRYLSHLHPTPTPSPLTPTPIPSPLTPIPPQPLSPTPTPTPTPLPPPTTHHPTHTYVSFYLFDFFHAAWYTFTPAWTLKIIKVSSKGCEKLSTASYVAILSWSLTWFISLSDFPATNDMKTTVRSLI